MRQSPPDPEKLNPRQLIDSLSRLASNKKALDEVLIRRNASTLFFALFNYWAAKSYAKGRRARGHCPYEDCFPYSEFLQEMLGAGLEYAIYPLYLYRVLADHYTLNPTKVILTSRPFKNRQAEVGLSHNTVDNLLRLAYDVLEYLEKLNRK